MGIKKVPILAIYIFVVFLVLGCNMETHNKNSEVFSDLSGDYLGQEVPGAEPRIFAPNIISTGLYERDIAMTPDGKEIYYCAIIGNFTYTTIMFTKQVNKRWTKPEVAPFASNPDYWNIEPHITPDGQKLFFMSNRPDSIHDRTETNEDIWVMDRVDNGWSKPYNLGSPINSEHAEFFPSVTRDGTMYFTRRLKGERADAIYRSRYENGQYSEPERLGPNINTGTARFNAFIDPDERFLIVPVFGRSDSHGATDYYVCFRNDNNTWTEAINLGEKINTQSGLEYSPYISPDGQYFFFMASRLPPKSTAPFSELSVSVLHRLHNEPQNGNPDIWWVEASFIMALKPE